MNPIFYAAIILLFAAVVLATGGVYEYWNSRHGPVARRVDSRIRAVSAGGPMSKQRLSILKSRTMADSATLTRLLLLIPRVHALDLFLQQSGLSWSVGRLVGTCAVLPPFVLIAGATLAMPWPFTVGIAAVSALLPLIYVQRRRNRRIRQLERQLPDVCDMLARALRSGHAFTGAIDMVATEFSEPMSGEFRIVFDEINYGVSISEALTNLATRVPIRDLRYFVIAVVIQRETGGNLAEVLDGITALIRDRFKLFDKVRVLAAEGKMSAWVLGLLPFGVGAAMMLINPGFLNVLWQDPAGVKMIGVACAGMLFGILWMRHIVKIRV
ncbi:type II secretion system F family protein [Paraburkholderia sp. UYCP14C]|uniref:type II secretion system F family protein n=1 Tax=Paraburkholderia sp. UYCP14C TaxID=2511130 RepID=UPI001020D280|nr:type II secretion system F family protein [Paraburkholderia sp. UYCP14C]RZF25057.1 type II secretion system F family protein [Paraburkholderia sp. UYCP14C]